MADHHQPLTNDARIHKRMHTKTEPTFVAT
jgi:hypothetical protein